MSWLFGLNKGGGQVPLGDAPQVPVMGGEDAAIAAGSGGAAVGAGAGGADGYRSDPYSFDSTALERAAKAAKVLFIVYELEEA